MDQRNHHRDVTRVDDILREVLGLHAISVEMQTGFCK